MRHVLILILILLIAAPASAQEPSAAPEPAAPEPADAAAGEAVAPDMPAPDTPALDIIQAGSHRLDEYLWLARPLVVFADSPRDPRFLQQMEYLKERPEDLIARDVVVIIDTAPSAHSPIREALRPRGFSLVLIGKDGQIYLRKPLPWHVREIVRSIDKMPIRRQEVRDRRLYPPPR